MNSIKETPPLKAEPTVAKIMDIEKTTDQKKSRRPSDVPEKFWDSKTQQIRIDALLKSYYELERILSQKSHHVPEKPEDYKISVTHDVFGVDEIVNKLLHEAGFSNEQAQLVYDLAVERLLPVAQSVYEQMQEVMIEERLVNQFGGEEKWEEMRSQISMWAKRNLPENAFQALASSYEGIMLLHRMMSEQSEQTLLRKGEQDTGTLDEKELHALIRDPRYWRDGDMATIERVRKGFQRLYPQ